MIYFTLISAFLVLVFFIQEFIPVLEWAYHSRMLLVHAAFFCAAVTVPYPLMLALAFFTGFVWEARYHLPIYSADGYTGSPQPELPFGFTIFLFGLLGSFIQGVRPVFRRGRWELPVFMIGVCTLVGIVIEYLVISFHRGGFVWTAELWFMILMTSLFSMLAAPFILLLFSKLAKWTGYKIRMEGITKKYSFYGNTF